ncbi:MAG: YggS family pyridoxal phosphate-dependent enzyme [Acidimicrobiales bacterium]
MTLDAVATRLEAVRKGVKKAGGDPALITVVAVTKGQGPDAVRAALKLGLGDIGENYAGELIAKAEWLNRHGSTLTPRWHFLGPIQRNKVRSLARWVSLWHGVARVSEGAEIARHAPGARVLVQVDLTGTPGRNGVRPDEVPTLVARLAELDLNVRGLMTLAPPGPGDVARAAFRSVSELARELELTDVSMGMTQDFEEAIRQGATIIRVGQGLFGARPAIPVSRRG